VAAEAVAKKAKQTSHPTAAEISEANRLLQAFVGPTTLEVAQAANETAKEIVKASVPKFKVGDKVEVGIAICKVTHVDGDVVEVNGNCRITKGTYRASDPLLKKVAE
jgi:hypothetical protein